MLLMKTMCTWAMRCLLVQSGERLVLIDNGIGEKQDAKFFSHYYLSGEDTLGKSLRANGFSEDDITDVFLTHLHFDHCGGSIKWNNAHEHFEPTFKNAKYWSNERHWKWATEPNAREKASFLKENIQPIRESGQLFFLNEGEKLFDGFETVFVNGHTDAMMLPVLSAKDRTVIYCADLLPSAAHLPVPYVMAYDTRPLLTLEEKSTFLNEAMKKDALLFFEHDPSIECASLVQTEKGVRAKEMGKLGDLIGG
jgi:glyoxylase-like metal-dependent hydrolase (beta-lactamase superfamily II)